MFFGQEIVSLPVSTPTFLFVFYFCGDLSPWSARTTTGAMQCGNWRLLAMRPGEQGIGESGAMNNI